jgi:hypothetical protein
VFKKVLDRAAAAFLDSAFTTAMHASSRTRLAVLTTTVVLRLRVLALLLAVIRLGGPVI